MRYHQFRTGLDCPRGESHFLLFGFWARSLVVQVQQGLKPSVYGIINGPAEAGPFPNHVHVSILRLTCGIMLA
jgi:hypothetical protein